MRPHQERPRGSTPSPGCSRCRYGGAIDVLLCRQGHPPRVEACRCTCPKGQEFRGLASIDRYTAGWASLGATVVEWPSVKEREFQGTICNISQDVPPVQEAR